MKHNRIKMMVATIAMSATMLMSAQAANVSKNVNTAHEVATQCYYVDGYATASVAREYAERVAYNTSVFLNDDSNRYIILDLPNTSWEIYKKRSIGVKCLDEKKRIYSFKITSPSSYAVLKHGKKRVVVGAKTTCSDCKSTKGIVAHDSFGNLEPHRLHVNKSAFKTKIKYNRVNKMAIWTPVAIADAYRVIVNTEDYPPFRLLTEQNKCNVSIDSGVITVESIKYGAFDTQFGVKKSLVVG